MSSVLTGIETKLFSVVYKYINMFESPVSEDLKTKVQVWSLKWYPCCKGNNSITI